MMRLCGYGLCPCLAGEGTRWHTPREIAQMRRAEMRTTWLRAVGQR